MSSQANYCSNDCSSLLTSSFSEEGVHLVRCFPLKSRHHVRIDVHGHGYGGVTEHLLDNLRVHTSGEKERSGRVTQIVETNFV